MKISENLKECIFAESFVLYYRKEKNEHKEDQYADLIHEFWVELSRNEKELINKRSYSYKIPRE